MSLAHLQMHRLSESSELVEYVVLSTDFNEERSWQPVAMISINKKTRDYDFSALNEWKGLNLVQPKMYALPLEEFERLVRTGVSGYYGAWTGRIHSWATQLIEKSEFPERFP